MKSLSYEELREYVEKELKIPNNPRIIHCHSKQNYERILTFVEADDDIRFFRPWAGYPEIISKGDYISTDTKDIYGIKSYVFKECYIIVSLDKEPK